MRKELTQKEAHFTFTMYVVFNEKYEKLSLSYPQYPLLSGPLTISMRSLSFNGVRYM